MIKTGNKELDNFWKSGLKPGGLIIISGRPSMGKTSILLSIGQKIAEENKTLLISLELSIRLLKKWKVCGSIPSFLFDIDDTPDINLERLSEKISQYSPSVVLIDYVQIMSGKREELINGLKTIAVKFNTCLIASSTLGRAPEYRSDKRPIITDLTTSEGSDFNSADIDNADIAYIDNLTFIYRDKYYNRDSQKSDKTQLIQYEKENMEVIELDWPMCYFE
jgi:replicative DNA helicase